MIEHRVKASTAKNDRTGLIEKSAVCPYCARIIYLDFIPERDGLVNNITGGCEHLSGYSMGGDGNDPMNTPLTFLFRKANLI